ncbi:molecular chaperone DnaK [Paenibacillus sp. 1_12]|uniref:Hsp70 family protein n=1 Tax=Paenibacillus sp. 1_12 TaxID=1566278 RepID=UPI0008E6D90A|nr:Hsp70 family protein [Paenibacillus sp. 1_12]SFK75690.1 molecular chaperone DnaK [Paenibacillus sp. 1_12]
MKIDFGIDFGTTNSACVGILDGKRAIRYTDGYTAPFPSLVIIDKLTGEVLSGREAWNKRQQLSESCEVFSSIKSWLGENIQWNLGGKVWTPEMIAAEIFKGLVKQVSDKSGDGLIQSAVVAVPVDFSAEKRQALRYAAKTAGITITSFVSESTAAIFHNFDKVKSYSKVAVFDWGGGTLDISILENNKGSIREVSVGNEMLGGDDIDSKLARWAHNQIERANPRGVSFEDMPASFRDRLIAQCETAKRDLSVMDLVDVRLNKYGDYGPVKVAIDNDTFTALIEPEVLRAMDCMNATLEQAKINFDNLGCILLVGGSINLRPFIERVEQEWNCHKIFPDASEWSVAYGAAELSLTEGSYIMSESVGVILSDGGFYPIIKNGESMRGNEFTASFALVEDSDTANLIFANENGKILGYAHVPSFGFFKEQIDITVSLDQDMVIHFKAKSKNRSDKYHVLWSYPGPKMTYKLPDSSIEVITDAS